MYVDPGTKSPWNSLERWKLGMSVIGPIVLAAIGYFVWDSQQSILNQIQQNQTAEQNRLSSEQKEKEKIREFRFEIFKKAGPLLNEILSYHFYVGKWKERQPADIVADKRDLDSLMYSNAPLLTSKFFELYRSFMQAAFKTDVGWDLDTQIKTQWACRKKPETEDDKHWRSRFTNEDNREKIWIAYQGLLEALSNELLLHDPRADLSLLKPPIYPTNCPAR